MARKQRGHDRSSGGNRKQPSRAQNRSGSSILQPARQSKPARVTPRFNKLTSRNQSARDRALHVLADLRRDPSLTFTQAADNRGVSLRTIHKYLHSAIRPDESGRIKAKPSDRLRVRLQIPSTKPGESIAIKTTSSKERQLVGQWHSALNVAAGGDFSLLHKFPKNTFVDGVRLPTGPYEVQKILDAQAESERKLEGPYKSLARPS